MIPETGLPPLTVLTAETAPVAVTVCVTSPLSMAAVRYLATGLPRLPIRKNRPTPAAATTTSQNAVFFFRADGNPPSRRRCSRRGVPGRASRPSKRPGASEDYTEPGLKFPRLGERSSGAPAPDVRERGLRPDGTADRPIRKGAGRERCPPGRISFLR